MPATPEDASVVLPQVQIEALAVVYDRFAHAIDPHAPGVDAAETTFTAEVALWYDNLEVKGISLHEFRKQVILRCKRHLKSLGRTSTT
jgi:hypothetical protein